MEDPTAVTSTILSFANVFAWIAIAYFFMTGKIFSAVAVEKFLEAMKETTVKQAQEVADQIERAVENGVIKAYAKMDGKGSGDGD